MKSISTGIDISYLDEGRGPAILFVHGFPLDHQMWHAQVDYFKQKRRVIAPDLRGFGQTRSQDDTVSMEQFADDLIGLLDKLNIDQVDYCGLSMGGYIGWQFLTKYAERVRRAVLCDTRAAADTTEAAEGRRKMARLVRREGTGFVAAAMLPKIFAREAINADTSGVQMIREVILNTAPGAIAAAQEGMAERPDMTEALGSFDIPSLLLCGEFDELSPPAEMESIAAAMPQARFVEIAGAGHMAPLEKPEPVNQALAEFLA